MGAESFETKPPIFRLREALRQRINKRVSDPSFQGKVANHPLLRRFARRDQRALFDLMAGFTYTQVLLAAIRLDLYGQLLDGPRRPEALLGLPKEGMEVLCRAAASLGLLKAKRDGTFALRRLGVLAGSVPGLAEMIEHHSLLYSDLSDPIALLEKSKPTEMAAFWPYVFGAEGRAVNPDQAKRYSKLMGDTQALVARETLSRISLAGSQSLLDIGGGFGGFLTQTGLKYPDLKLGLFDLEVVTNAAPARFEKHPGSFRSDPLPSGYDAHSLIRIFFDHQDDTVKTIASKSYEALSEGGQLIISEPMAGGGEAPHRQGDCYYALYCHAMQTGRVRRPKEIAQILGDVGFQRIQIHGDRTPMITRVITARK